MHYHPYYIYSIRGKSFLMVIVVDGLEELSSNLGWGCVSVHADVIGKGVNLLFYVLSMGRKLGRVDSLTLQIGKSVWEKENFWIQKSWASNYAT